MLEAGGRVLDLIELTDVYMILYLPEDEAGRAAIGAEARIILDAAPRVGRPGHSCIMSPPRPSSPRKRSRRPRSARSWRSRSGSESRRELLREYEPMVKIGIPGVVYVRLDSVPEWPAQSSCSPATAAGAHEMTELRAGREPGRGNHRYGAVVAVAGINLEIPAGTTAGFIGPDGAGKSTLLALIAGAKRIQAGRCSRARR